MLALILREAGWDPSFVIGAPVLGLGVNGHAGTGPHLVVEADGARLLTSADRSLRVVPG